MRSIGIQIALIAATVALCVSGCGGSTDSGGSKGVSLNRAEFVTKTGQICEARLHEKDLLVGKALKRYASSLSQSGNEPPHAKQELIEGVTIPFEKLARELSELPVSGQYQAVADDLVRKIEAGLNMAESDPRAFALGHPFAAAGVAASAHGLKGCNL